jgi:hypothetical protein
MEPLERLHIVKGRFVKTVPGFEHVMSTNDMYVMLLRGNDPDTICDKLHRVMRLSGVEEYTVASIRPYTAQTLTG